MKKLVLAAVATMSLLSFAGEAPAAKKMDAKPVAAPAKTVAAAPAKTELKKEDKKETLTAAPAESATTKTETAKPAETKKVVTKKK